MLKKTINRINNLADSKIVLYALLALIISGGFLVRLYKIDNPIADWHSWRQVDTASVSKVFVEKGIDLLHPRYHDISKIQTGYENPEGYRYVEFPVYNLVHAGLVQAFPQVSLEVWGRIISVLSALFTAYFLYGIGKKMFDKWVGLLAAFFYAFIPFNIYFTRVILPDPLAVSLGVGSVYFFVNYVDSRKIRWLLASAVAMALAVLVKPHALFFGAPIVYLAVSTWGLGGTVKNKWLFIAADIVLIPFLLWRIWMYREGLLRGIAHWEWAFNGNGIRFRPSFWFWIFGERLAKLILGYWGVFVFGAGVFFAKKINIAHAFLAGAVLYVSVFASANVMHDYYQVFIIPAVAFTMAVGAYQIWRSRGYNKVLARGGLLGVVLLMFALGFYNVRGNWRINDTGILLAGQEADRVLPKDALVIAPYNGDTTFLYQTGRSGWPAVTTSIENMVELGADYYISVNLGDTDTTNFMKRFTEVARGEGFVILDLHEEKK